MLPVPFWPLWPAFGHLWFVAVRPDEVLGDGVDVAACVAAVLDGVPEPVAALATVRPRARLAPSAPAPMAVPMSGRVILTVFSFVPSGAGSTPGRSGPMRPQK